MGIQVQPCCCGPCVIGTYNPNDGWALGCITPTYDIYTTLGDLSLCKLLFAGPWNAGAGATYSYSAPFQTAVKAWVEAGGRLFLTANPTATFDAGGTGNVAAYNSFLGFLGTGMQLTANIPFGCPPVADCVDMSPAGVGIMIGLPAAIQYANGSGEISGGTVLGRTSTAFPILGCDVPWSMMAAEQIGSGLVVACGSSNVFGACPDTDGICEFFNRLCSWSVARILAG